MKKEYIIRLVAGSLVLTGVALSYYISLWWLLLPVFVGVNLVQSSFTGFCPLECLLDRMGVNKK